MKKGLKMIRCKRLRPTDLINGIFRVMSRLSGRSAGTEDHIESIDHRINYHIAIKVFVYYY